MTKNKNPHQAARDARIQELEHELALLRSGAPLDSSIPRNTEIWLIDTIRQLLSEHDNAGIAHALQQLGEFLQLLRVSLWRFDLYHRTLEPICQWPDTGEQAPVWISCLLRDKRHSLGELQIGEVVQFHTEQPPENDLQRALAEALCGNDAASAVLVPVQRHQTTVGVIMLCRERNDVWRLQDLNIAAVVGDILAGVDERQRLMAKLAERDTRFQYAMEASRDGLWDWDIASGNVYLSRSYLRMVGYEHDHLPAHIDTLCKHFLLPEDCERVMNQLYSALENRRTYVNMEFRMRHKNGQTLWIFSRAKFVEHDENGRARRCVGINADITDFIKAREELLQSKAQADLANRTKAEFLARMSHEIRTPMNAIIGLGHLMQGTALDEQQQSHLDSMSAAADSLMHLINQILDFSKIESGKIILEKTHFDLEQVLEKLSRLFEVSVVNRKVEIVYNIAPDVPRFLRGDAMRLNQVLSNLVGNALRYSQSDNVVVRISKEEEDTQQVTLVFDIVDTGVGMTAEQLALLQHRMQWPEDGDSGDIGFGLSICQHLVSLMHGEISLDSQPGHGCSIRFSARFEHSHIGAQPLRKKTRHWAGLRTLVVDDNAIARDIIASTARLINLHADTADGALTAMERLHVASARGTPYQLVLMDYQMPAINGLEAMAMIKGDALLAHKPWVILVSSYQRDEVLAEQENAQLVDGFISKPVSESRLFDAISAVYREEAEAEDVAEDEFSLLKGLNVLVAEDNQVNQQVICGILKKRGVQVTLADNGREAVEKFNASANGFDVVLMDIEMPEVDGFEATRMLRQGTRFPQIPIIAVTAQAIQGDREQCLKAGMNSYVSKPIKPATLYSALTEILRSKSLASK